MRAWRPAPALTSAILAADPVINHEYPIADALTATAVAADPQRSGKVLLTWTDPVPSTAQYSDGAFELPAFAGARTTGRWGSVGERPATRS